MKSTNIFKGKRVRLRAISQQDAPVIAHWDENAAFLQSLDTDFAFPRSESYYQVEIGGKIW